MTATVGKLGVTLDVNARVGEGPAMLVCTVEVPITAVLSPSPEAWTADAVLQVGDGMMRQSLGHALVDAGLEMLGTKRTLAEHIEISSTKISDDDTHWSLKIDGHEFPWYLTQEGPTVSSINPADMPTVTFCLMADRVTVNHEAGFTKG